MQSTFHPTQPNHLANLLPLWLWITGRRTNDSVADRYLSQWPIDATERAAVDACPPAVEPKPQSELGDGQVERTIEHLLATQLTNLSHNLAKARDVQLGFMPQTVPTVPGLELASELRPAAEVGGDFYDFVVNRGDTLFFSVGDVSSKGISAAMLTPVIGKLMRTGLRFLADISPRALLGYMHDDLYHELSSAVMFSTMFIGHYDPATRAIIYANAGHSPVIYRPAQGCAHLLQADGPPVGLLERSDWSNNKLTLHPGDLLLIGTDGLTEARNSQGQLFGHERLLALVDRLAELDVNSLRDELFTALYRFSPSRHADDDQTMVLLKGKA